MSDVSHGCMNKKVDMTVFIVSVCGWGGGVGVGGGILHIEVSSARNRKD